MLDYYVTVFFYYICYLVLIHLFKESLMHLVVLLVVVLKKLKYLFELQ